MNIRKILFWVGVGIAGLYVVAVFVRMPYVNEAERTKELVAEIHATQLTLADVMGEDLPPDPGEKADATVAGVDENENGIRDDVELAIFGEYPDSAKTRAALLQYALALQMQFTQPIVNTDVVVAVTQERSRASTCISEIISRDDMQYFLDTVRNLNDFVREQQINNPERNNSEKQFLENIDSYTDLTKESCDIDQSIFQS